MTIVATNLPTHRQQRSLIKAYERRFGRAASYSFQHTGTSVAEGQHWRITGPTGSYLQGVFDRTYRLSVRKYHEAQSQPAVAQQASAG